MKSLSRLYKIRANARWRIKMEEDRVINLGVVIMLVGIFLALAAGLVKIPVPAPAAAPPNAVSLPGVGAQDEIGDIPAPGASVGGPVVIQAGQPGQVIHTVQPGENLFRIGQKYGTTIEAIMQANRLTDRYKIGVGQSLVIPQSGAPAPVSAGGGTMHIVQPGENLFRIGLRYGVTAQSIASANGISNPRLIFVGQKLLIPPDP